MLTNKLDICKLTVVVAIGLVFAGVVSAAAQDVMQPAPDVHPVSPIPLPSSAPPASAQGSQTAKIPSTTTATAPKESQSPQH